MTNNLASGLEERVEKEKKGRKDRWQGWRKPSVSTWEQELTEEQRRRTAGSCRGFTCCTLFMQSAVRALRGRERETRRKRGKTQSETGWERQKRKNVNTYPDNPVKTRWSSPWISLCSHTCRKQKTCFLFLCVTLRLHKEQQICASR